MNKQITIVGFAAFALSLSALLVTTASYGVGDYSPELYEAIRTNNIEETRRLLDVEKSANSAGSYGWTPLHQAALCPDAEIVIMLIERGADVNAKTSFQWTPLHLVRNPEAAQLLIAHGADIKARDAVGRTPLHHAILDKAIVEGLYKGKAEEEVRRAQKIDVISILLTSGSDPKAKDDEGKTPVDYCHDRGWVLRRDCLEEVYR